MARQAKATSIVELELDPKKFLQDMQKLAQQTGQTLASTIEKAIKQGLKTSTGARPMQDASGYMQGFRGQGGRMVSGAQALGTTAQEAAQFKQAVNTAIKQEYGRLQVAGALGPRLGRPDVFGKQGPAGSIPFSSSTMQSRLGIPNLSPGQTMAAMANASAAAKARAAIAQSKITTPAMEAQLAADRRAMAEQFIQRPPELTRREQLEQRIAEARTTAQAKARANAAENAQYPFRALGRTTGPQPGQSWSHWASTQFPTMGAAANYQNLRQQSIDLLRGQTNQVNPMDPLGMLAAQQISNIGGAPNGTNAFGRNLAGSAAANNLNNPANRTQRQAVSPQRIAWNIRQNRLGNVGVVGGGGGAPPINRLRNIMGPGGLPPNLGGGPPVPPTPPAVLGGGGSGGAPRAIAALGGRGGITRFLGNIGGVVGSAMLLQQAFSQHAISTEQIQRNLARTGQDARRDVKALDRDWDATMVHYSNAFKDINEDRTKAQRNFDQHNKEIFQHEQRALEDNQQQRVEMNQQALRMQTSMQRQEADYRRDLRYAEEDFNKDFQATYREEAQARRGYEREISSIKLNASRRTEDYEHDITNIVKDRDRYQRDVNKRAGREARDLATFEENTEKKRQKQLDEAQEKRGDYALDSAIAGLGMMQAMRQGGLMGILQAYKQYKNVQEEQKKNEETIARGGLTEEQQQQIDAVRQGFADKAQDLIDDVADYNTHMLDSIAEINKNYARGVADDATKIKQAGEDIDTTLEGIKIKQDDLINMQIRKVDALNQQNDRFWIDMGQSIAEWRTGWAKIETQVIRIEQDAQNQRMQNATDFKDALGALDRVERDAIIGMGGALLKDQEARDKIQEHMKRAIEDAKTQQEMADEQLKMGVAFNILFSGMALKNLRDTVGSLGDAAKAMTGISGGVAKAGLAMGVVAGVTALAIAAAAGVVQAFGWILEKLTGSNQGLDVTKIDKALEGFSHLFDVIGSEEGRKLLGQSIFGGASDPSKDASASAITNAPVDPTKPAAPKPAEIPGGTTGNKDMDAALAALYKERPNLAPKKQHGGIVSEPAMLIGLRSNRFLGTVAEAGPEVFSPTSDQYMRQQQDLQQQYERNMADMKRLQVDVNVKVDGYGTNSAAFERALEDAIGNKIIEFIEYDGKGAA